MFLTYEGIFVLIQFKSLTVCPEEEMMKYLSNSNRMTVQSLSNPPLEFNNPVYTIFPFSTATFAQQIF